MQPFQPFVDPGVHALRPDFRAISIVAEGVRNAAEHPFSCAALEQAERELDWAGWADEHVLAWREAFSAFGAKAKKTPSSLEALRTRAAKGGLPRINAVVDLYNAISVRFALPVGGEDVERYSGTPRLTRALGDELFDTIRDGAEIAESPEPGEVVWRDDLGVTCRRWNWRQGVRTRVQIGSTRLWFVLEALGPMPDAQLRAAAGVLCEGLAAISPGCEVRSSDIE